MDPQAVPVAASGDVESGRGSLYYSDGSRFEGRFAAGVRHGRGRAILADGSLVDSVWQDGASTGHAAWTANDGRVTRGAWGCGGFTGRVTEHDEEGDLAYDGEYSAGERHGAGIAYLPDGARLHGHWVSGEFEGDNNEYHYPDLTTVLRGIWKRGRLVSAVEARTSEPEPDSRADIFEFDPSTRHRLSRKPTLQDPYEKKCVEVLQSTVPSFGEGLFAKISLPPDRVVAYFSGLRLPRNVSLFSR